MIQTLAPEYNSQTKRWYMVDATRIKKPSKRNFLLGRREDIMLKMGKLDTGAFVVDFKEPFSLLFAFAVALSTNEWRSRPN